MPTLFVLDASLSMHREYDSKCMLPMDLDDSTQHIKYLNTYFKLSLYVVENLIEHLIQSQPDREQHNDLIDKVGVVISSRDNPLLVPFTSDIRVLRESLKKLHTEPFKCGHQDIVDLIINASQYSYTIYNSMSSLSIIAIGDVLDDLQRKILAHSMEIDDNDNCSANDKLISSNVHLTMIELEPPNTDTNTLNNFRNNDANSNAKTFYYVKDRFLIVKTGRHKIDSKKSEEILFCLIYNDIKISLEEEINIFGEDKIIISCGHLNSSICYVYPKLLHHKVGWKEYHSNERLLQANIVGFVDIIDFQMAPVTRKYLILNIDGEECIDFTSTTTFTTTASTNSKLNDSSSDNLNDYNSVFMSTEDTTNQHPNFEILLFGSLKMEDMYAVVQLKDNQYGVISTYNFSRKKSTLMLSVLKEGSHCPWLGKFEQLATSIAFEEYPYVCDESGECEEPPFPLIAPSSSIPPPYSYNDDCVKLFLPHSNDEENIDQEDDEPFSFTCDLYDSEMSNNTKITTTHDENDILRDGYDIVGDVHTENSLD